MRSCKGCCQSASSAKHAKGQGSQRRALQPAAGRVRGLSTNGRLGCQVCLECSIGLTHWVDSLHKEKFISELKAVKEFQKYEELSYSSTADTCERRALFEEYKRDVGFMQLQLESKDVRCYSCDMSLSTFKHGGTPKLHRAAVHDIDVQWQRRTPQPPAGRVRGPSTNGRFGC